MRIRVLGCCGGSVPNAHPSCYLLDRGVAIDAGALAARLTLAEQRTLEHVFLTHAHWDHIRDLPLTIINREEGAPPLHLHGLAVTLDTLRDHVLNDAVWFRALELPTREQPLAVARPIGPGETREVRGYNVTPVLMRHTIPATGFLVDDGSLSVVFCADTHGGGVLDNLPLGASPLRAVFIESSFPDRMHEFAELTGHLTPSLLLAEVARLPPDVVVFATHMKPGFEHEIEAELAALPRPGIRPARDGETLVF